MTIVGPFGGVVRNQVYVIPRYLVVVCIVDPISDVLSCVIVPRGVVSVGYAYSWSSFLGQVHFIP